MEANRQSDGILPFADALQLRCVSGADFALLVSPLALVLLISSADSRKAEERMVARIVSASVSSINLRRRPRRRVRPFTTLMAK